MMPMRRRGGLIRSAARTAVVAGTATAVSGRVAHNQQQRWAGQEQAQAAPAPAPAPVAAAPPPAPAAPEVSPEIAELQQLAALHEQGILTDEEFAAKKAQVLGI